MISSRRIMMTGIHRRNLYLTQNVPSSSIFPEVLNQSRSKWHRIPFLATIFVIFQGLICFFPQWIGVHSEEDVVVSWENVMMKGQYWRLFVAHFFHFGRLHLVLNALSLFCFSRYLERKINWLPLVLVLEVMGIGSNILFILLNTFIIGYSTESSTCGFSHIHFGLRILVAYTQEPRNYEPSFFLGLYPAYLSPLWAPWQPLLEVGLLKLIIHELNVTGHVSGISTGFLISFALKIFPQRAIYTEYFLNARTKLLLPPSTTD